MRPATEHARRITDIVRQHLGDDARVRLFGSRTCDTAHGGDIDLLIETVQPVGYWQRAQLLAALERVLGQAIDLGFCHARQAEKPLHRIARASGILPPLTIGTHRAPCASLARTITTTTMPEKPPSQRNCPPVGKSCRHRPPHPSLRARQTGHRMNQTDIFPNPPHFPWHHLQHLVSMNFLPT